MYRNDLCSAALEQAGLPALRPERQPLPLACGVPFDQDDPISYLQQLSFSQTTTQAVIPLPSGDANRPLAVH